MPLTGKSHGVLAGGEIVVAALRGVEARLGVVVGHGVLVAVVGGLVGVGVNIGLVGHGGGGLHHGGGVDNRVDNGGVDNWPVDNHGGVVHHGPGGGHHTDGGGVHHGGDLDDGSNCGGGNNQGLAGAAGAGGVTGAETGARAGSKSFDEAGCDGVLEVGASEHGHVVGGLLELEEDWQVLALGRGGRRGQRGDQESGLRGRQALGLLTFNF